MEKHRNSVLLAVCLVLLTTLVVVAYYLNHPAPESLADTRSYLLMVERIQAHGQLVDPWRLPGFPLLIILVGQGNLAAISAVHAILFVLATLEVYCIAALVLRRAWIAFIIALLVGINIPLLSYVKPIMTEAMGIWLLTTAALAVVSFVSTLRLHGLWLTTVCLALLFLTRPEWIYLPLVLFVYLFLVAVWRGAARRALPHILLSLLVLYSLLGGYIAINYTQNHFAGITLIQNINELGKVLQYRMQDEAPPQYIQTRRILDTYVSRGVLDPYPILAHEPSLSYNYATLAGSYAQSIILHHPGEFLFKSVPLFFSSLTVFYQESSITPHGPFGTFLTWLQAEFRALYEWNILFPFCAGIWLLLLCPRRTRHLSTVQMMGVVALLGLYGLITTTLGAYRGVDYMRIHTLFDPLTILLTWGSLLVGALLIVKRGPGALVWLAGHTPLRAQLALSTATLVVAGLCGIGLCLCIARLLLAPALSSLIAVIFFFMLSATLAWQYFRLSSPI